MAEIVVPPQWTCLSAEDLHGTVMVLGASDTGKSTLACYLYQELCRWGYRAAYLDADVGQSTLGMPTTQNLALASEPGDERFPPHGARAAYFVGSITPRGHMLPVVVGTRRLQERALALGASAIVVDTTGLVDKAQGGKALKQWKIELLAPNLLIGLQRGSELEPILWPLRREGRVRCVDMPISPYVVERSRDERIGRRQERLAGYFEAAQPRLVPLRHMAAYDLEWLAVGAFLAFQDAQGFALGLGVVEEMDRLGESIVVRTPLPSLEGVTSVRFGSVRWDLAKRREIWE